MMADTEPGSSTPPHYLRYWGKTGSDERDGKAVPTHHPVAFHGLDVAACGLELLRQNPLLFQRLSNASGLERETLLGWVAFLLTTHDLGKLADGFQALSPEWMQRLQGRFDNPGYPDRHDSLGFWLWAPRLGLVDDSVLRSRLLGFGLDPVGFLDCVGPWLHAAAGHHGRPPRPLERSLRSLKRQFPQPVVADARSYLRWSARRFLPEAGLAAGLGSPGGLDDEQLERVDRSWKATSWLFAGLAVAADWLGSNEAWFPHVMEPLSLDGYWETVAVPGARRAVAKSGLIAHRPSRATFGALFPGYTPTPLQELTSRLELAQGPQLFVIEESTGGGKTEAALVLAQRLMAAGQAQGLFLGLPTMATANAMYDRVEEIHRKLFEPSGASEASLILAHSRRHLRLLLQETMADTRVEHGNTAGNGAGEEELTASGACTAWLADGRKRALLADVGVGTIDQALLAVLPVRHQSIRLYGLVGKVLLVDEVHACDSYVHSLLKKLLRFHAAYGGSAILLSATLPQKQRRKLVDAFCGGLDRPGPRLTSERYPLLTHAGGGEPRELPVESRADVQRQVEVAFLDSETAVENVLLEALDRGLCACWIRNTVDDAREAFERLRLHLGDRVELFHSRFTVEDRNRIEVSAIRRFGKNSAPEERRGRLLIVTQVVEQSLDLDFDVLVTDLCPIDLVIQRAGRLRRHRRTAEGARTDGPDLRGPMVLHVLAPPLEEEPDAGWYRDMFPRAACVYEDHGRLWLTAGTLQRLGGFRIPEEARDAIESVYGPDAELEIPEALMLQTERAVGDSQAAKALADLNAVKLSVGYKVTSLDWPEDAYTPTRLGEPTVLLRLARHDGDRLVPFAAEGDYAWERSEVSVHQWKVAEEDPALAEELEALRERMGPAGRWTKIVVMEPEEEGWRGRAVNEKGEPVECRYDATRGLEVLSIHG